MKNRKDGKLKMDYKDIKKLMDDMGNSKLEELEIEFPDGIKISMKKRDFDVRPNIIEASAPMTVPMVKPQEEKGIVAVENKKEENCKIIKSPMVRNFLCKFSTRQRAICKSWR